ncbi:twin-arginine translocase subunit TatC [bacterium]|nr:twin-arginine translocase subunit TatC [bacterium]
MTVVEHLTELRNRVVRSFLFIAAGAVVSLIFCKDIYHALQVPMLKALPPESHFIVTSPFESYVAYFKIALVAGLFIASPFVFYQIWRFVLPGLKDNEKKMVFPFALLSGVLFTGGALFGYFVVFPAGFYYVNAILDGTGIVMLPRMEDYLGVALTLLVAFGVCFELPLFIFLLGKLGILTSAHIKAYRRYVIVILFVVAAVLTPGPDVISQVLLALPMWILFEAGGLSLKLIKHKN